jgi:hypothetical protein
MSTEQQTRVCPSCGYTLKDQELTVDGDPDVCPKCGAELPDDDEAVDKASEDSFPASDPPSH